MSKRTTYRVIRVGVDGTERTVTWSYDLERACNAACGCALIANLTTEEAAELTGMDAATLKDPLPRARSFEVREGKTVLRRIHPAPKSNAYTSRPEFKDRIKRRLLLESGRTPEEVEAVYEQRYKNRLYRNAGIRPETIQ